MTANGMKSDLMRGGCFAMALWLHRKTELPLYGLFDEAGDMHHALVLDEAEDVFYDARGRVQRNLVGFSNGRRSAGTILREATVAEVQAFQATAASLTGIAPTDRQLAKYARETGPLRELLETERAPAPRM